MRSPLLLSVAALVAASAAATAQTVETPPTPSKTAAAPTASASPAPTRQKPVTLKGGPGFAVQYLFDLRGMGNRSNGEAGDNGLKLMAAEADVIGTSGQHWDWGVQVPFYTEMRGRGRDMHFGNAYAIYRGKLGAPTLKLGQFVVPFAMLSYYETHSRPVQTVYPYSLGVRIDPGVEVEGYLKPTYPYQVSVTAGNGSYRAPQDGSYLVTARVSHTFEIGGNELRLGLSAAQGRLPAFSVMHDPVMENGGLIGFRRKTLAALDGEYYLGPYLLRAEVMGGANEGRAVYGHWVQFGYPLNYKNSLEVGTERWSQPSGDLTGFWFGAERKFTETQTLRLAVQHRRMRESMADGMGTDRMRETMLTLQLYRQF